MSGTHPKWQLPIWHFRTSREPTRSTPSATLLYRTWAGPEGRCAAAVASSRSEADPLKLWTLGWGSRRRERLNKVCNDEPRPALGPAKGCCHSLMRQWGLGKSLEARAFLIWACKHFE